MQRGFGARLRLTAVPTVDGPVPHANSTGATADSEEGEQGHPEVQDEVPGEELACLRGFASQSRRCDGLVRPGHRGRLERCSEWTSWRSAEVLRGRYDGSGPEKGPPLNAAGNLVSSPDSREPVLLSVRHAGASPPFVLGYELSLAGIVAVPTAVVVVHAGLPSGNSRLGRSPCPMQAFRMTDFMCHDGAT